MSPDTEAVIARLDAIRDPIDRAAATQQEIVALTAVRDAAMRQAWAGRRAGSTLSGLASAVGCSRAAAALAVSRMDT